MRIDQKEYSHDRVVFRLDRKKWHERPSFDSSSSSSNQFRYICCTIKLRNVEPYQLRRANLFTKYLRKKGETICDIESVARCSFFHTDTYIYTYTIEEKDNG